MAPIITSLTLPPQALNIGDQHNLIVGIGTPYATSEATVLATLGLFVIVPFEGYISVGPSEPGVDRWCTVRSTTRSTCPTSSR